MNSTRPGPDPDHQLAEMHGSCHQVIDPDSRRTLRKVLHDIADLVLTTTETSAREQHRKILQFADKLSMGVGQQEACARAPRLLSTKDDLRFVRETSKDIHGSIHHLRTSMKSIDEQHREELAKYRELVISHQVKLQAERNLIRRLKAQLNGRSSCRNSQLTSRSLSRYSHESDGKESLNRMGLGALTVRSMTSARTVSPKIQKDHGNI